MPRLPIPYTHAEMMRDRKRDTEKYQKVGLSGRPRVMMTINVKFGGKPLDGPVLTDHVLEDGTYFRNDDPKDINEHNYNAGIFYAVYSDLKFWNDYLKVSETVEKTKEIFDAAEKSLEEAFNSFGSLEQKAQAVATAHKHYKNKQNLLQRHRTEQERLAQKLTAWGYDLTKVTEEDFKV